MKSGQYNIKREVKRTVWGNLKDPVVSKTIFILYYFVSGGDSGHEGQTLPSSHPLRKVGSTTHSCYRCPGCCPILCEAYRLSTMVVNRHVVLTFP